jgi:tetraacyldisaccharide 4'-kinase
MTSESPSNDVNNPKHHPTLHNDCGTVDRGTAGLEDTLLAAIDGAPGARAECLRGVLLGLSWLYTLGVALYLLWCRICPGWVVRLPAEVVSVGNLSVGGTGKTLAVQRLARALTAAGKRVVILSRGYRRRGKDAVGVVSTPDAVLLTPADAGDEPCLLARSLPGVPVLVGKNRRRTGRYAMEQFQPDVILLDDGFQYWRLRKDREIVLLDALQPPAREQVLPRGLLREPWGHLRRAHEVWITHAQLADPARVTALAHRVYRHAPQAVLRCTEHQPVALRALTGDTAPLETLHGRRILALSGLGNPAQFEAMLAALGAQVVPCRYPDHHPYSADDLAAIAARLEPEMLLVTTAKDAIRLPDAPPMPVWIVDAELADVRREVVREP